MMTHEDRIQDLERRMDTSDRERQSMLELLRSNNDTITQVANDTQELRQLWSEARGAFRLFARLVALGRWVVKFVVLPLAFLLAALYAWTHEGKAPTWLHSITDMVE
jgi:hypothetical protein